jgi:hypothetical protein
MTIRTLQNHLTLNSDITRNGNDFMAFGTKFYPHQYTIAPDSIGVQSINTLASPVAGGPAENIV